MSRESAPQLLDRVRALPAAQPLLEALAADPAEPVFLVGGAVRDLLRGADPVDLDLAVEGPIEPLAERLGGRVADHERFVTATLIVAGVRYDLAQTRAERYPHPGALPMVRPASIEEDLERRDFTVNAIALGLAGPLAGHLLAVDAALADLEARRLAVLHEQSFGDDPTRLLRLARYRARLGFEIAPGSRALARATLAAGALATVSGARIGNELRLLAQEPDPVAALSALHELGADAAIDPILRFDPERAAIARQALAALASSDNPREPSDNPREPSDNPREPSDNPREPSPNPREPSPNPREPSPNRRQPSANPDAPASPAHARPRRDLLALAVALLDAPRAQASRLLDRLELTAPDRDAIVEAATTARPLADRAANARKGSEVAHSIGAAGVETVAVATALLPPSQLRGRPNLQRWLTDLRHRTLHITGDDLIASGIPEGPRIGDALAAARDAMLDDLAPDRETQLRVALGAAR